MSEIHFGKSERRISMAIELVDEKEMTEQEDEFDEQFENEDPSRHEDGADDEATEHEYLIEVEEITRELIAKETEKSDANKVFNKGIKDIKKRRLAALSDLEAYRLGQRGLFDGE
jgi:hypothetical protein